MSDFIRISSSSLRLTWFSPSNKLVVQAKAYKSRIFLYFFLQIGGIFLAWFLAGGSPESKSNCITLKVTWPPPTTKKKKKFQSQLGLGPSITDKLAGQIHGESIHTRVRDRITPASNHMRACLAGGKILRVAKKDLPVRNRTDHQRWTA